MRIRTVAALLALLAPHVVTNAQTFSETVEVRVTNVEAVVTDRSGKPVAGLTKDDFEIFENGVRQEISNFDEIRESAPAGTLTTVGTAAPPAAAPQHVRRRLITIFVDDASLNMGNRNAVLPHLRRFLSTQVRPGDSVAIVAWGNSLSVELEPTSDAAAIQAAAERLSRRARANAEADWRSQMEREIDAVIKAYRSRRPPEDPPMSIGVSIAAGHATRLATQMRQKAEALRSVISATKGLDGRKVLVLLTESFSSNPGEEAFQYLDTIKEAFAGDGVTFNVTSESRLYEVDRVVEDIAAAANAAGVTLYPIHAAGKSAGIGGPDASTSALLIGTRPVTPSDTSVPALHAIASDTGGYALAGSTNWQLAFDTIANDLNIYYSLGYRTSGARQDRVKRVEVRLKNKRYTVRSRKAVVEQTAASEMTDVVAANLFQPRSNNDLGVAAAAGAPALAGEKLTYPITITIPTSTLTLVPDGNDLVGKFSVFAAFLRADGAVSRVSQQTQQLRFPADSLSRRKQITVKLDVTTDPTTNAVSFGVMDETSRATGFSLVTLKP